jgi:hypothetical protein
MKKKIIGIIIFILIVGACVGIGLFFHFRSKTKFNDGYVNGNRGGNLYNGGLFCEYGDYIYFANPSDEYHLYVMRSNGADLKLLSTDIVSYINADENYIYYVRNNPRGGANFSFLNIYTDSLVRVDRDTGDNLIVLDEEPTLYATLVGNYVYYLRYDGAETTSLYKVKIDGSGQTMVNSSSVYPCSAVGQYIYYNGVDSDHYIWRLDTSSDLSGLLLDGTCWMPIVDGNYVYYMDCDKDYHVARVDMTTGDKIFVTDCRVDSFNVYGDYVYFLENDGDTQCVARTRTDGTGYEVIVTGVYNDLNLTKDYVYFRDYSNGYMYRAPVEMISNVKAYNP